MKRTYNADPAFNGMFGNGWSFSYDSVVSNDCNGAFLRKGSGQMLLFNGNFCSDGGAINPPITTSPPQGNFDKLTLRDNNTWLYECKDDRLEYVYEFVPDGEEPDAFKWIGGGGVAAGSMRLTKISDKNGNTVSVNHNSDGTIQKITDAAGRETSFVYDANKRCTAMKVPSGKTSTYAYDSHGNLVQTVDLAGNVTTYGYDADNYLNSMTTGDKVTRFAWSGDGRGKLLGSLTDAGGNVTEYTKPNIIEATVHKKDPRGGLTVYQNVEGKTSSVTDPLNHTVSTVYADGLPVNKTDARGNGTKMTYDSRGNMTTLRDRQYAITTFDYDASDNLVSKTDPLNRTWTFSYDARQNLTGMVSPMGNARTYAFDALGQKVSETDANNKTYQYTYDEFGNILSVTDPLSNVMQYEYDADGLNMTAVIDPRGNRAEFQYDANRRMTQIRHPDNTVRKFTYDCCMLTGIVDENGHTTSFEHSKLLQRVRNSDPLGNAVSYSYDGNGNLTGITDPMGNTRSYAYDGANRRTSITSPAGGVVEQAYDNNGNMTVFTDQRSNSTAFSYFNEDRLYMRTDPLSNKMSRYWDAAGQLLTLRSPRGDLKFTYDADGRMVTKSHGTTQIAAYTYDSAGRLVGFTDSTGSTSYTRDGLARVIGIQYPDGTSVSMTYDAAGNMKTIGYPGGVTVTYTYDTRNRLTGAAWGSGRSISIIYDRAGNPTGETRSNGTSSIYTYDRASRLVSLKHLKGNTAFAEITYARDKAGNITGESCRLPVAPNLENELFAGTYNPANQLVSSGDRTFTYDVDGNLTAISGNRHQASYDLENRMTSVTRNGSVINYTYNALGQRTISQSGTTIRNHYHDHFGRLLFTKTSSGQHTLYIYAQHQPVAMELPSGACRFFHYEKTGNTLALTDENGSVSSAWVYAPGGVILNRIGTDDNPFTWVGAFGVMDDGNGLYFMKTRYYDVEYGRFVQQDPIGFRGGSNLYAYAGGNPVNRVDPSGESWKGVLVRSCLWRRIHVFDFIATWMGDGWCSSNRLYLL
jgi:RHS repeat-associated protein